MKQEFVQCDQCECWNQEHWVYYEEVPHKKNELWGVCQRHAPHMGHEIHKAVSSFFIGVWGHYMPIGILKNNPLNRVLSQTRYNEGCWEGIKKPDAT